MCCEVFAHHTTKKAQLTFFVVGHKVLRGNEGIFAWVVVLYLCMGISYCGVLNLPFEWHVLVITSGSSFKRNIRLSKIPELTETLF